MAKSLRDRASPLVKHGRLDIGIQFEGLEAIDQKGRSPWKPIAHDAIELALPLDVARVRRGTMLVTPAGGLGQQCVVDHFGPFDVARRRHVAFRMFGIPLRVLRIDIEGSTRREMLVDAVAEQHPKFVAGPQILEGYGDAAIVRNVVARHTAAQQE